MRGSWLPLRTPLLLTLLPCPPADQSLLRPRQGLCPRSSALRGGEGSRAMALHMGHGVQDHRLHIMAFTH